MEHWQQETMSRARSLRQRFADSRSSASSSLAAPYATPAPAARWQSQHAAKMVLDGLNCPATRFQPIGAPLQQQSSTDSETMVASSSSSSPRMSVRNSGPAGSKSPSPSRAALAPPAAGLAAAKPEKRPTSVSWMMVNPRAGNSSRPATPTAPCYPLEASASMSAVPSQAAVQHQQMDDFSSNMIRDHSFMFNSKVNLDRRGVLAAFKSKSLDLLGTSRILLPQSGAHRHPCRMTDEHSPGRNAAAERRRRLFRRKKANSASGSYDESPSGSPQSRSSSLESNSATHTIHRGLESALKASTLFAWSSIEASTCTGHLLQHANQPSFIELLEDQLKSGPEMTRIEHLSDLHYPDADPPCHFCSNQSSLSIHDSNRLKIVSGGRVRGRDGSRDSINPPYINLPSPNVQDEESELFPGQSRSGSCHQSGSDGGGGGSVGGSGGVGTPGSAKRPGAAPEDEQPEPPASVLTRRRALVPPKIPPYNMDSSEDAEQSVDKETSTSCAENEGGCGGSAGGGSCGSGSSGGSRSAQQRRSSIVVIPPMQICPGDLLVYSKVLTQRSSVLDWEGSTQSLAGDADASSNARKQKNSWSLLKLFDRSGRTKSESLSGLEEVLTCLQPSTFFDDQLSRYRGLCWIDFLASVQQQQQQHQKPASKATKSTLTSTTEEATTPGADETTPTVAVQPPLPPPPPRQTPAGRNVLVRQSTQQDYSSRLKEWTQEKRARFGLVRTMSERCLDRKTVQEVLPCDPVRPAPPADEPHHEATTPGVDPFLFPTLQLGPKSEQRRREALWDLFQSECAFLYDHLMVLKNVYMDPLKKIQVEGYAMFAEPELLFGNLDELCCVTYSFCKEFITLLLHHAQPSGCDNKTTHILTKLFQKSSKAQILSQAYHRYALNYINALNYLETLRRHVEFCEFEKWCNRDPRCKKLQLTDLLVAPVQHIMKVPLLLREIEQRTEDAQEKEAILKILDKEEASLRELDDKMKWLKNFERLLEIQRSLVWPSVLDIEPKVVVPEFLKNPLAKQPCERLIVSPRRQIVLEGPLSLLDTGRPMDMHVILFDDMLLITRKKKGLGKKKSSLSDNWAAPCSRSCLPTDPSACWRYIVHKQPLSLDRFFLHEINPQEAAAAKLENGFVIISLNRFQQIIGVHTFQASSEQVKHTWLMKLRETQDHWKRTLQTTVFRAQRTLSSSSSPSAATHPATTPLAGMCAGAPLASAPAKS